jgi:peroxiredoxin
MSLTFPVVIDTTGEIARTYGVRFTPTHFLIDRAGTVRAGGSGGKDWNSPDAHAVVRVLLEASSPAPSLSGIQKYRVESPPSGRMERR